MVAVKTKRRLQTHPNILLACLALTDLMIGLVVQPLHIAKTMLLLQEKFSPDVNMLVRHFGHLSVNINSVLNPVIYTVRKRQFRVAFSELLLKKSFQEAEEFDRRLFGSPKNNAVRRQNGQEGEGQEQNAEERNAAHANDKQEDNPEVLATGANVNDNTTLATQNEPVSSNALNSISKKTEEEHGGERNPAHANDNQEDNPEVLATGANVGDNTTLAI
ncbi:hypothetical protein ACROYT_G035732 [Oculina patagonica]